MKKMDLFARLGLEKLSEQEKLKLSDDLGKVALDRIAARFEVLLTPAQMAEFESKLEFDEAEAFALLEKYIPDYQEIVKEEVEAVRAELLDMHERLKEKLDL